MDVDFYNKVAKKIGGYKNSAVRLEEHVQQNPEQVFKEKLLEFCNKDSTALDIGCADGRFTLSIAGYFKNIIAIDLSSEMLKAAKRNQKKLNIKNVNFEKQDAFNTKYPDGFFDLIYSRRGPLPYREINRLLKNKGIFIHIGIGEKDALELKKIFGRGQGFNSLDKNWLIGIKKDLIEHKMRIRYTQWFIYKDIFPTVYDFDLFLQGVPIIEDFGLDKDKPLFNKYLSKYTSKKGVLLNRHRVVIVAEKK